MNSEQLKELLIEEIKDIYHAEKQLVRALPKMAKAAESENLKEAIQAHLAETEEQVNRLESVFSALKTTPKAKPCKGMQGLIEEGSEAVKDEEKGPIRDLAIIGAAQRVEHYEIAAYGTARAMAEQIGNKQAASLLRETEDEEKSADEKLSQIAGELYGSVEGESEEMEMASASKMSRKIAAGSRR